MRSFQATRLAPVIRNCRVPPSPGHPPSPWAERKRQRRSHAEEAEGPEEPAEALWFLWSLCVTRLSGGPAAQRQTERE